MLRARAIRAPALWQFFFLYTNLMSHRRSRTDCHPAPDHAANGAEGPAIPQGPRCIRAVGAPLHKMLRAPRKLEPALLPPPPPPPSSPPPPPPPISPTTTHSPPPLRPPPLRSPPAPHPPPPRPPSPSTPPLRLKRTPHHSGLACNRVALAAVSSRWQAFGQLIRGAVFIWLSSSLVMSRQRKTRRPHRGL